MSDRAVLLQRVLAWSNGLMAVCSLDQLAAGLSQPPAADGESLTGVLLLLDPAQVAQDQPLDQRRPALACPGRGLIQTLPGGLAQSDQGLSAHARLLQGSDTRESPRCLGV